MKERELWLDYLRAFACVLVAMGHLFMSFRDASIKNGVLISYGIYFVYRFHVHIFFFCSGYLMQKLFQRCSEQGSFLKRKAARCVDFLIIYVVFSFIIYAMKAFAGGDVNTPLNATFFDTLLNKPINQMWYLYAIFVVTLCTPMIKTARGANTLLLVSVVMSVVICIPKCVELMPVPVEYLFGNQLWYVLGIIWAYKKIILKKWIAIVQGGLFVTLVTIAFVYDISNAFFQLVLSFLGLTATIGIFYEFAKNKTGIPFVWQLIAKYMLQIYLLHTIFASGIRIILMRMGVLGFWVHLPLGIIFSIAAPAACGAIANRVKVLNILFYPTSTLKEILKRDKDKDSCK